VIDRLLIVRKLSQLRQHLARIDRRRPVSFEAFRDDVDIQDAISLSLLVAVQEATDIALHLAADEGWGVPASYAGAFDVLASHAVIDADHADALKACVAVRNRIAHGYASVDARRLYEELPEGAEALQKLAAAVARHVGDDAPS